MARVTRIGEAVWLFTKLLLIAVWIECAATAIAAVIRLKRSGITAPFAIKVVAIIRYTPLTSLCLATRLGATRAKTFGIESTAAAVTPLIGESLHAASPTVARRAIARRIVTIGAS